MKKLMFAASLSTKRVEETTELIKSNVIECSPNIQAQDVSNTECSSELDAGFAILNSSNILLIRTF